MIQYILLLITTAMFLCGCNDDHGDSLRLARINHVVFFSLKSSEDTQELIHDCDSTLSSMGVVVSDWCGEHGDFGRPAVDDNYDVGLCVGFNSDEDYGRYVKHPDHLALVNKWKHRWNWIRMYDVVDETP